MNLWLTSFRVWIQLPFMCAVCDLTRWNDWSHLLRKQERDSCAISNTYTQNDTVWIGSAFAIKRTISFRHSHEYITATQLAVCHQYVGKKVQFVGGSVLNAFLHDLNYNWTFHPCHYVHICGKYIVAEILFSFFPMLDANSNSTSHSPHLRCCTRELFVELHFSCAFHRATTTQINTECILVIKSMRFENVKKCAQKVQNCAFKRNKIVANFEMPFLIALL